MLQHEPSVVEFRFDTLLRLALGYFDTAENALSEVNFLTILAIVVSW